jgi:hypothetical protein
VFQATELSPAVDYANSRWSGRLFEATEAVEIGDLFHFEEDVVIWIERGTFHADQGLPLDRAADADTQPPGPLDGKVR